MEKIERAEYILIEDADKEALVNKVNEKNLSGFNPQGGICYSDKQGLYIQAMIKIIPLKLTRPY